jgi:ATP-binding cassette subfamily B protein
MVLAVVAIGAESLKNYGISKLFDLVVLPFTGYQEEFWSGLIFLIIQISAFILLGVASFRLGSLVSSRLFLKISIRVKKDLFDHLQYQSADYFNNTYAGRLAHRMMQASEGIMQLAENVFWYFYETFIHILIPTLFMFVIDVKFAILFLSSCGVFIIGTHFLTKRLIHRAENYATQQSEVSGRLVDILTNILSVKSFTQHKFETKRVSKDLGEEYGQAVGFRNHVEYSRAFMGIMEGFILVSMFLLAIYLHMKKEVSVGNIVLILTLINQSLKHVSQIGRKLTDYFQTIGMLKSSLSVAMTPHEVVDSKGASELHIEQQASISFEKVSFYYGKGDKFVFKDLSVDIASGEKVGLVGRSGAGKSTFINLLLRFYDVCGGQIKINHQDIKTITQESLRKHITIIPQDTLLFHRSIRENIAYGKIGASDEEIIEVAKKAFAHEFIKMLPKGYDTIVGERGMKLSVGQRQRIAIARAILKDAPILLLDEATSALDSESETYIRMSVKALMKNKTVIAIAHRLSTLLNMDRILVFDKGVLIEEGKHNDLIKDQTSTYAKLWSLQVGKVSESELI